MTKHPTHIGTKSKQPNSLAWRKKVQNLNWNFFTTKRQVLLAEKEGKKKGGKKKKENASLKLFPNLYKKERKKIKDTFIKVSLTVRKSKTSTEIFFTTKRQVLLAGKKRKCKSKTFLTYIKKIKIKIKMKETFIKVSFTVKYILLPKRNTHTHTKASDYA